MVEVEECAAVRSAVFWAAPPFVASGDVVSLGPPLTGREQTAEGLPATKKSEARIREEELMV